MIFMRRGNTTDGQSICLRNSSIPYREGADSGRLMNPVCSAVVGQPFRARCVREFIEYAQQFPDVWFTTREKIAKWYLKNHESHIPVKRRRGRTQTPANQIKGRRKKKS